MEIRLPHSRDSENRTFIFRSSVTESEVKEIISPSIHHYFLSSPGFTIEERRRVISAIAKNVLDNELPELTINPLESDKKAQGRRIGFDLVLPAHGKTRSINENYNISVKKITPLTQESLSKTTSRTSVFCLGVLCGLLICA